MKVASLFAASIAAVLSTAALAQPAAPGEQPAGQAHGQAGGRHGAMMSRIDTDRDGALSRAEIEAAHQQRMQQFDRADADRDGKLTQQEMRAFRTAHRDGPARVRGADAAASRGADGAGARPDATPAR